MKDKLDIIKTLLVCIVVVGMVMIISGCSSTPRAQDTCVTWTDGSDPRARSSQNTECKSRQRTTDILKQL